MKKLSLDPETLRVQSFETTAPEARGGTVVGHERLGPTTQESTEPIDTCGCVAMMRVAYDPGVAVAVGFVGEPVRAVDSAAPGCTTVWTGCGEGL